MSDNFTARIEVLRRWAPFDKLEADVLRWAAERMAEHRHGPETLLLQPGEMPERLYFLAKGQVRVEAMGRAQQNKILAEMGEGSCFPIEALHEHRPVFSYFRVVDEALTWSLSAEDFDQLLERSKNFAAFCDGRSATLLDQSRQLYSAQFAFNRPNQQSLDSPLAAIIEPDPLTCAADAPLRAVVQALDGRGIGTMSVVDEAGRPVGVYTLRDVLRDLASGIYDPDMPVREVMNPQPNVLPSQAIGHEAAMAMARGGTRHALVCGDEGRLLGVIHERDLFGLQRVGLGQISESIRRSRDIGALERCAADIRQLAHNLIEQGVGSEQLTQLISTLNDQLTSRIIHLETVKLAAEGSGIDDLRYCWLAFGSEGRHEQTLSTDQDNGIVFADGDDSEATRARLTVLAKRVNEALDACGFPLCKGNIMASNPECLLSLSEWKERFRRWIAMPDPQAILNSTIFFDFRPLHGDFAMAQQLREWLVGAAPQASRLLTLLVDNALQRSAPLGVIRDFVTDKNGCIDLKLSGITLFVDAARVMALATGVAESGTRLRLRQACGAKRIGQSDTDGYVDAFHFLQVLRVRNQHAQHINGEEVNNLLDPSQLNPIDRKILIESLRQAAKLQKQMQGWLGARMM